MTDARYYSITLQNDRMSSKPGVYELQFSTMPGMSTTITDLRMGDLDALARILADRADAANGMEIIAAPRPQHQGEPCPHCKGVGSACQCDVEYV